MISTDRRLAKNYVGGGIPKMLMASEHTYILHDFRTRKTRRNLTNFRHTSKDADLNKVILKFD